MKFIIFDCDGVLINSESLGVEIELQQLARIGLKFDPDEHKARFLGMSDADYYRNLDEMYFAKFGRNLPVDVERRTKAEKHRVFETDLRAFEGLTELGRAIGSRKAVASSSTVAQLERKLELTGLYEMFAPAIYSSELVDNGKPAPDLFLLAAQRNGVGAECCIVIEDSVVGVQAGLAADMTVWGFTGDNPWAGGGESLLQAGADQVFDRHVDILARLRVEGYLSKS